MRSLLLHLFEAGYRCVLAVLLLHLLFAPSASAQEPFATYPLLPTGYHSIKVFDHQGRFVGRLLPEQRYWVTIDRIPSFLQKAVVAVEDARFYEHGGIDLRGIARAVVKDVVKGRLAEGGSTITQQLIKNRYLTAEKSLDRKVKEGMMAIEFEKKYTKQQILEMYFNEIYYGNGAWGIAQAARIYFDKAPEELSDVECSFLAGIPKNPGRYNPLGKSADVAKRRTIVLKRMAEVGVLSARQLKQQLGSSAAPLPQNRAPWYLALIRAKLLEQYGAAVIEQGGLEVTAALDLPLQLQAEQLIHKGVTRISPQLQGALVALEPASGDLLAVVGGTEFTKGGFNRALQARRQPGSAIKPLIYAAALEQGVTAASIWSDAAVAYPKGNGEFWQPQNYDGRSHGEMSLRQALASSNNVIAVKLLASIGIPAFTAVAERDGLHLPAAPDLSVALGTAEVTPQELVAAYTPFANGGVRAEPRSILRVYDSYRRSWAEHPPQTAQVLSPAAAFITTQMLKDVLISGTAKQLKKFSQHYPAAGKTGTTSDYHDAWFVGYTPQLVAGIWVGYDQPRSGGKGFTGGAVAAPLWEQFMRQALKSRPVVDFPQPENVISVAIDSKTGLLAGPDSLRQRQEFFVSGTEPLEYGNGQPLPTSNPVQPPELPAPAPTAPKPPETVEQPR